MRSASARLPIWYMYAELPILFRRALLLSGQLEIHRRTGGAALTRVVDMRCIRGCRPFIVVAWYPLNGLGLVASRAVKAWA